MKTVGSVLLTLITILLLPIVIVGWTLRTTTLESSFFITVMEESGFWESITEVIVDEYVTKELVNGDGIVPSDALQVQLKAMLEGVFSPVYLSGKSVEIFEEVDRWMNSKDSLTQLDIKVNLGEIKAAVPVEFRKSYESMPACTAAEILTFTTSENKQIPACRLPDQVLGIDTSSLSDQVVDGVTAGILEQLEGIPDEFSTRAYFAGEIPAMQPTPEQLLRWDRSMTEFRGNVNVFKRTLVVFTVILILSVLGAGAVHIPAWRSVLRWITIPVFVEAIFVFLFAVGAWTSAPVIGGSIVENLIASNGIAPGIEQLVLGVLEVGLTLIFVRMLAISGIVVLITLILFIISFFLPKEPEPAKKV